MLLFLPIVNAFFILGLYWATGGDTEGDTGPLRRLRWFLDRWGTYYEGTSPYGWYVGRKWYYPVLYCPVCMSSLWGTLFYAGAWAVMGAGWGWLLWTPVHVLTTYGLVSFLHTMHNK